MGQTAEATESQRNGVVKHKLGCDKYHAHQAPDCCSQDCWCQGMPWDEIGEIVRKIEHAARHEADFSDPKITNFVEEIISAIRKTQN